MTVQATVAQDGTRQAAQDGGITLSLTLTLTLTLTRTRRSVPGRQILAEEDNVRLDKPTWLGLGLGLGCWG